MQVGDIDTIAVLGAGAMGHGIAEVAALAGYDVRLRDIEEALVQSGIDQIEWSLDKLVEHDRISEAEAEAARDRVTPVVPLEESVGDADFVIEAVPERMEIKRSVYNELSPLAPKHAIFASNTSSLSITELGGATDRPERFCGMHFFNPPVRMELVEVVAGEQTAESTLDLTEDLAEAFGKTPVRVEKDSPGFIVNRILVPVLNEAAWMVHHEEATIATVDSTAVYELGLPMGAFELADHVGIDVALHVLEYVHEQLGAAYEPCPIIEDQVANEQFGKKSGVGFYEYDNGGVSIPADATAPDVADRLLAMMANEVAKLLADEVADVDAIDTAVELGLGFPAGPVAMADDRGLDDLIAHLEARAEATGHERYNVSDELVDRAASGGFRAASDGESSVAYDDIRLEFPTDHVGAIVIDRPHRMNAISFGVLDELVMAIEELEDADDIRAILIRGAGDRAFSAGADVQAMSAIWGDSLEAVDVAKQGQTTFGRLEASDLPVIAAIDGFCLGGGMELATAADLRIASDRSTFGQPERDLGLIPGWGGTQRLARIVGEGRAKEIILTGDRYDAKTMAEYGFVNRVFDHDEFVDAAVAFAAEIARGPPIAQAFIKHAMHVGRADAAGLDVEALAFGHLTATDDLAEGISAFVEDRDPEFTGE